MQSAKSRERVPTQKIIIKKDPNEKWRRKKEDTKNKTTIWTREPNVATINARQLNKINMPNKEWLDVLDCIKNTEQKVEPVFIIDSDSKIVSWELLLLFLSLFFIQNIPRHSSFFRLVFCLLHFYLLRWSEAKPTLALFFSFFSCSSFLSRLLSAFRRHRILHFNFACVCESLSAIFVCCCRHFADLIEILSQTLRRY